MTRTHRFLIAATNLALAVSVLAFVPSAAAFTPAVAASIFAALVGIAGACGGVVRRGILTLYFSLGAVLVSPALLAIKPAEPILIAIPTFGALLCAVCYWQYRTHAGAA